MRRIAPARLPTRLLACLLAALPVATAAQPSAARPPAAVALRQMDHISVTRLGTKGSPVLLIPGLSSPRGVWDGIAPDLARTHRVFLVQVNGFAGDDPRANLAPGVLAGVVADLHALVAAERLEDVAVIGHSMGGLVGLMLARDHPADLSRLMVVDALPFFGTLIAAQATPAMLEPRAAAMRDALIASYGKPADAAQAAATADRLALKPGARALVRQWATAADPRVTAQALYEDLTTDLRADLATIATPLTVVVPFGGDLPQARAHALYTAAYAAAPQTRLVEVADSAHFVMLDQPAAFADAVGAFLRR